MANETTRKQNAARITPVGFPKRESGEVYNASEIVPLGDGRFLFCDNNIGDALLELRLAPDGSMAGPLLRRPLNGLAPGAVDDMEGMALVEHGKKRFIFVTPSLSLKQRKKWRRKKTARGKLAPARGGLLRVRVGPRGKLDAELIPNFREWVLDARPELRAAAALLPDDGGLNVEGLGWDPAASALLFGLRTPVAKRGPIVLRVRVKKLGGPWELSNLEMLEPRVLTLGRGGEGIRSMEYDPVRETSLVVVGNATSESKAPFRLYAWDGDAGAPRPFRGVTFAKRMKAEGVTHGTIGGRGAVVFVDDGGGYGVVWDDDPRLAAPPQGAAR